MAIEGIKNGYRQCLHLLKATTDNFEQLCETYDFLQVDVLDKRCLDDIIKDLKAGDTDVLGPQSGKELAQDSAFRLVYLVLRKFSGTSDDITKLDNVTSYLVGRLDISPPKSWLIVTGVCEQAVRRSSKQIEPNGDWESGSEDLE